MCLNKKHVNVSRISLLAAAGLVSLPSLGLDTVFQDSFANGSPENSNSIAGFWTQRDSGSNSIVNEGALGPVQLSAGGSTYPHAQLASEVRSEFNFFRTPINITASGLNFTSSTGSLNKSVLRFCLTSQALADNDKSEYTSDDVLALRIESGNNTPGHYAVALGIKENYPNHNSEYDGYQLVNPGKDPNMDFPGPIRAISLTYSPTFYDITITHDASPTDATQQTYHYYGAVNQFMANWTTAALGNVVTGNSAMIIQNQLNNAASSEVATASVGQVTVSNLKSTWLPTGGEANWSDAASWSDANIQHLDGNFFPSSVPDFIGANVKFNGAGGTVVTDHDETVGVIDLDSNSQYIITPNGLGEGTLQMDTRYFNTEVNVLKGSHIIYSPMILYKDIALAAAAGTKVTLGGQLYSFPAVGDLKIIKNGAGEVETLNARIAGLTVNGGTLKITSNPTANSTAGSSLVKALTIAGTPAVPTAKLDLQNNAMVIDYTGASPQSDVRSLLKAGFNNGAWTGNGITTSSAIAASKKTGIGYAEASELAITSFAGQSFDGTSLVLAYTLLGDTNLSGNVDSTDFSALAGGYGLTSGAIWRQGDSNYDGKVNTIDFNYLADNFGSSTPAPLLGSVVPEPTTLGAAAILLAGLARRRK